MNFNIEKQYIQYLNSTGYLLTDQNYENIIGEKKNKKNDKIQHSLRIIYVRQKDKKKQKEKRKMTKKQHRRGEYGQLLMEECSRIEKKGSKWIYYDKNGKILNSRQMPVTKAFYDVRKIIAKLSTETDSHG